DRQARVHPVEREVGAPEQEARAVEREGARGVKQPQIGRLDLKPKPELPARRERFGAAREVVEALAERARDREAAPSGDQAIAQAIAEPGAEAGAEAGPARGALG